MTKTVTVDLYVCAMMLAFANAIFPVTLCLTVVCCNFLCQEDDDLPYEEEIIRNPYSVKCWMRYIEFKQNGPKSTLNMIYERALKELPGR